MQSRAEQSRAEQSRAEQSRARHSKLHAWLPIATAAALTVVACEGGEQSEGLALTAKALTSSEEVAAQESLALGCIASHKQKHAAGVPATDVDLVALGGCYRSLRDARVAKANFAPVQEVGQAWLAEIDSKVEAAAADLGPAAAAADKKAAPPPAPLPDAKALAAHRKPTQGQRTALLDWFATTGGRLSVRWDGVAAAPRAILGDLDRAWLPSEGASDDDIAAPVLARLDGLCPGPQGWSWKALGVTPLANEGVQQLRFGRYAGALPVFDEFVEISVGPDARTPTWRRAFALGTSCRGDLPASVALQAKTAEVEATKIAAVAWQPALAGELTTTATLGVSTAGAMPSLVWRVLVQRGKESGQVAIDATTGAVLNVTDHKVHGSSHSGTLTMQVRKAYDASTSLGALPNAEYHEDDGCWFSCYLGLTAWDGSYSASHDAGSSNHTWEPRFVGPLLEDEKSSSTELSLPGFPATGGTSYASFANSWVQRRAELFYTLSFAWSVSKAFWIGIPTVEPLKFEVPTMDPSACNGWTKGSGDQTYIELDGWCSGWPNAERAYRFFSVHEFGHTFRRKLAWFDPCTSATCSAWKEAEGDMLALAVNRMESFRGVFTGGDACGDGDTTGGNLTDQFLPDDTIQDDCCPEIHDHANIFVGVHLEQMFDLGWKDALFRVFEPVDEIDDPTQWLRTTGVDGFYAEAIEADGQAWVRRAFEMPTTVNFSNHDEASLTSWQWTDQLPGAAYPMYPAIARSTAVDPVFEPVPLPHAYNSPLPAYALEHVHDHDYVWFRLEAGVPYEVRTSIPITSAVDTVLRAVQLDPNNGGAEVQVAINDDRATTTSGCVAPSCLPCASASWGLGSLSSCFVLTPQTSGAYALAVRAFNENSAGAYDFEVRAMDDAGGGTFGSAASILGARPLALAEAFVTGAWQTVGDLDHYRLRMPQTIPTGTTLRIEVCGLPPGAGESDTTSLFVSRQAAPTTIVGAAIGGGALGCGALPGSTVNVALTSADQDQGFLVRVDETGLDERGRYQVRAFLVDGIGLPVGIDADGDVTLDGIVNGTPVSIDTGTWGTSVAAAFELDGAGLNNDEDWYTIDLAEGEHVVAWTEGLQVGVDTKVDIWSGITGGALTIPAQSDILPTTPSRAWLRSDDDWGTEPLASRVHFVAPRAGQYMLRVRPYLTNTIYGTGHYVLHVTRSGWSTPALPAYP